MATSSKLTGLPALRKQNLLVEFAGLKQSCPEGVFVSLTPGDPALWSGVVFVRDGKFKIARTCWPLCARGPALPDLLPGRLSAAAPAGHLLHRHVPPPDHALDHLHVQHRRAGQRHRQRHRRGAPPARGLQSAPRVPGLVRPAKQEPRRQQTGQQRPAASADAATPATVKVGRYARLETVGRRRLPGFADTHKTDISTFEVLRYIRSTFDDEEVLDAIPLEAAGNSGAWHAWRSHRQDSGKAFTAAAATTEAAAGADENAEEGAAPPPVPPKDDTPTGAGAPGGVRKPGEWNWEGVWEARVKKAVDASVSEAVLYGGTGAGDDVIRFLSMEEGDVEAVKDNLLRTLEQAASL
ncbi:ubiquitin-conjugating enzyme [Apiospora arundinis]